MRNLKELTGTKILGKKDQKLIKGGGIPECVRDSDCPDPKYQVCQQGKCYYYW